jgi:hypothetical protein
MALSIESTVEKYPKSVAALDRKPTAHSDYRLRDGL